MEHNLGQIAPYSSPRGPHFFSPLDEGACSPSIRPPITLGYQGQTCCYFGVAEPNKWIICHILEHKGAFWPLAPLGGPIFSHAPTSPLFFHQFSPPRPNLTAIGPPYTPTQTLSHTCQNCFSFFNFFCISAGLPACQGRRLPPPTPSLLYHFLFNFFISIFLDIFPYADSFKRRKNGHPILRKHIV